MAFVYKALLLAHAVGSGVLVGASTHLALQSIRSLRGRAHPRLLRIYPPVAFTAWAATATLGAWMYPRYRIAVRQQFLDKHAAWASILFDVKENLAVFAGPLLLAAWIMCDAVGQKGEQILRRWFAATCLTACTIAWWNALSGLLVSSVRSV